ncbi:MAG TPA: choice-of-anchor D domain-containing protein [Silvibacterium sp.]|nr:choice-of-anchor D domain-containing protein [Silvibacterium sp.]
MEDQDRGASELSRFGVARTRIARKNFYAAATALILLAAVLAITGCGVSFNSPPTVSLSPATISWHKVDVGATSGPHMVTVTNTSPAKSIPLTISSFNLTANFMETDTTCPAAPQTLAPGASCTVSVAFRPQESGNLTGTFSLTDNATDTPQSVSLNAVGGIGFLLFNPTSLSFTGVAANTVSQPQTSTLTNEATTPVAISELRTSGKFAEGDDCPRSPDTLEPGGSCTVTVTANPVAGGPITGAINAIDSFGNDTQLYLSSTDQGLQSVGALEFTPPELQWGKVTVGSTSGDKVITVTNLQSAAVSFSNIAVGPDFQIASTTCPVGSGSLGGGSSCTVSVVFRPSVAGAVSELLTFTDNLTGSPQALSLKGTGVLGDMLFTPTSLLFAGVDPGQTSAPQTATLANETAGNISLATISVTGHFAQTNNCPSSLGPQASCTFTVTADPTADGVITGSVNVKDNAGNSVQLYLQGQGGNTDKVLSFTPNPVVWGTIDVGGTSGAKTLTVNNGQTVPLTIYSISLGPDFIQTASTCPTAPGTVAAGASCTISLAFRPQSAGAKSEVITFTDDAPGGNQSVSLRGTAATGDLLFSPASLSFAGVAPNSVSPSQTSTLTNESAATVTLASIAVSGHFAQTNNCGGSLAPQASCTFTVTSNPLIDGPIEGAVNVKDGTGAITQLFLSGIGGVPIGNGSGGNNEVSISPTSLAFGSVNVGQTSGAQAVTLSNGTTGDVTIASITVGPDIYETANTCPIAPFTLAGGAACSVSVAFRPQSLGDKSETLTFDDDASSSPQTATITGTGAQGNLLFTPTSLTFPATAAGSTSAAQTATLTNELTSAITLSSIQATGPFVQTNDCPISPNTLAAGASCTVSASAAPQADGDLIGTVDATDSTGAVTSLYLSGSASGTGGTSTLVTVAPSTLNWGSVAVGGSSGAKTVTFTNNQSAGLAISSITAGPDFAVSSTTCPTAPTQVAAKASCTVSLIFRPTSTGKKSEPLTFNDNAASSPQTAVLSGTGTAGTLEFSPGSLNFAATGEFSTSPTQTSTLTNMSTSAVTLTSITVSGAFTQTNNCPMGSFAPNATCTVTVAAKPTTVGSYSGSVNVKDTAGTGTTLALSATGTKPNTGSATLTPNSKDFGSVFAGSSSKPVTFTLTNNGATALAMLGITPSNANFTETDTCGSSLAGNSSCTISVSFAPQTAGAQTGTLTVNDDATNAPQTAKLVGTGMAAPVTLTPSSLSWGSISVGNSSGPKTLTFTNAQASAVVIDSITIGPDFAITANTCPPPGSSLSGTSCTLSVVFKPVSSGAKNETITFNDNAANSPQTTTLMGTATAGALMFTPGSLTFTSETEGTASAAQTATLTNTTGATVTLSALTVTSGFTQTNNCPVGAFAANATCTVTVMSKPTTVGAYTGAVTAKDSAGAVTQLELNGTGVKAPTSTATLSPSTNHFTSVVSGKTGSPVPFTLTNNGTFPIAISQIAISNANFTQTNNCAGSVAGSGSCTINVTFAPQSIGTQTATLTVTDDASNGPTQTAALSGTGLAAPSSTGALTVVPSSYTFPNTTTGTTSSPESLKVTNSLTKSVTISAVQIAAPFQETNNCGTLAAGASCTVQVTYSPTAVGFSSADLTFTYNATGSPQVVFIAGNSGAAVTVRPTSLGFSPQIINRPSSPQTITVTNNESTSLTITGITATSSATPSPYAVTNTCIAAGQTTGTLAANGSCTIDVTFEPTKTGTFTGSVSIAYNAPGGPQTVPYTGRGIATSTGVQVVVAPQGACIQPSGTEQYTADVTNTPNTAVNWLVNGTQGGSAASGTISTGGLYTAPGATGAYTIRAVSQANTNAGGNATINVTTSPSFGVYPSTASVPINGQQTFQGQLCGVPDTNTLTWAVDNIAGGNASVGTISANGVYTAPGTAGKHTIKATDSTIGKTANAAVTVYSGLTIDFGSRTNQTHPIAPDMVGANHVDDLHTPSDITLLAASGVKVSRTYSLIPQVYATQTPDWTQIDPRIANLQAAGMHVMLQVVYTPPWLQPNPNPCGNGNTAVFPTDVNAWAQIAASYVAHMDAEFPGVVTDYEIGNEPDAGGICSGSVPKQTAYMELYAAAAPLMKQQAAADHATIRVGGPALTSPNTAFISAFVTDPSTAPYVDFVSYHSYMGGTPQVDATWDTNNGTMPVYQATQGGNGAAAPYRRVAAVVAAGKTPLGAKTPIDISEYNTNWAGVPACCRNDPTYAPVWNTLFVSDLLDTVYSGTAAVPGQLEYFSSNAYPYFCLIGIWDSAMDCQYSQGSTTTAPYPQYYAYQLMSAPQYLGINAGGFMAASISPPADAGGMVVTGFYTAASDSVLIVNPTANNYSQITVTIANPGFSSPQAVLYQIVNGNSITSSSLTLTPSGANYTATITVPQYTVMAIKIVGP